MATVEGMFDGGFVTDSTTVLVLFWFPSVTYRFLWVFLSSVSLLTLPLWTATCVCISITSNVAVLVLTSCGRPTSLRRGQLRC